MSLDSLREFYINIDVDLTYAQGWKLTVKNKKRLFLVKLDNGVCYLRQLCYFT